MTWLTARELAGLPGMPASERRTRDKLASTGTPSRPRSGREGGGGLEYDCSALPAETRRALATRQIAEVKALPLAEPAPAISFAPPVPAPEPLPGTLVPVPSRRPPSQADKAVADARAMLVAQVQDLAQVHGSKKACALLALQLASGQASTDLLATARTASQRARGDQVSTRSLERWLSAHRENGWWGLLPVAVELARVTPASLETDVAHVLALYHSKDARFRKLTGAAKEANKALGREPDAWQALYARARRALDKLGTNAQDNIALIKSRHTGAQRDAKLPFKRRDTSILSFNDVWLIDGHTFKAKVRHPDHGQPFAPELTVTIDAATRFITGWSTAYSENVMAVGDALRHAIGLCGVPAVLYGDNGAGETAKQMDCPIDGFCVRLGIDHRTGLPGKPQGHGLIERSWQTFAINAARQFGSYQGKDVDGGTFRKAAADLAKEQRALRRSEATGEVVRLSPKAPSWQQFMDAVDAAIHEYNTTHRHRALPKNADGKHMTPAEARVAMTQPGDIVSIDQTTLRHLFMPGILRTARRGEVQFLNQTYSAPDLMRRDVDGRQVSVRYDIRDPSAVMVFSLDGLYICEAKWAANRIDYMPKPVIQMAREKRVAATIKLRQQQIDTALRELQPTGSADLELPAPDLPFFVQPMAPAIEQAAVAAVAVPAAGTRPASFDTQGERYEWLMNHRAAWTDADNQWLTRYVASDDYTDLADYYSGRGLGWTGGSAEEQPRFKGAR